MALRSGGSQTLFFDFGNKVREAVHHHRCLSDDAENDAGDIHFGRNKVVGEEIPDGVYSERDVENGARDKSGIVLATEDKGHHHMGQGIQCREVGRPQTPFDAPEVGHDTRQGQQNIDERDVDPELHGLGHRVIILDRFERLAVEKFQETAGTDVLLELVRPVNRGLHPDEEQSVVGILYIEPDQNGGIDGKERSCLHPVVVQPLHSLFHNTIRLDWGLYRKITR